MEEADLLRERLQAIMDKRRIQENIAMKKRQIEEEKLKLQYMKKKALREQWLMDGLSQQSEEELEAIKLQVEDEQQQSDQLKSNIFRIEKEIEALETQELSISANEEAVLLRLKEVERTAEDIIKELKADFQAVPVKNLDTVSHSSGWEDLTHVTSPLPDIAPFIPLAPTKTHPICAAGSEEPKKATFAMKISVEHDKKTGKSQVVSTATITPETIHDRLLKVYDDGRKSVYTLHPDGGNMHSRAVGEMTSTEVEELLYQATDKNVPTEFQYHQPVYSVPYMGNSRPLPLWTSNKTPTPSPSPFQSLISSREGAQIHRQENQRSQDLDGWKTQSKTPNHGCIQQDSISVIQRSEDQTTVPYFNIPGQVKNDRHLILQPHFSTKIPEAFTNSKKDANCPNKANLVPIKAISEGISAPKQPIYRAVDSHEVGPYVLMDSDFNRHSPCSVENITSLNLFDGQPEELKSGPITMIFMGYENAEDVVNEDIQAELVFIGNSNEYDDDKVQFENNNEAEEGLSYHPQGYKSKIFQPKVGVAKVANCSYTNKDAYTSRDELRVHKPTFFHKPGKYSP